MNLEAELGNTATIGFLTDDYYQPWHTPTKYTILTSPLNDKERYLPCIKLLILNNILYSLPQLLVLYLNDMTHVII